MNERLDLSALIKSVLVHLAIISMFFVSWKSAEEVVLPKAMPQHVTAVIMDKKPQPPTPQKSAPQPKKPEPPKPEPKKPEPKKPEPKKPEPKKPEPKKPEPKKPEPKKPEPKKPEPKKPEPKKPEPKKPEPKKPEPKKPAPKQESLDFSDILQNEMKHLDKKPAPPAPKKAEAPVTATASANSKEQDEIQEYIGLIQQAISRNWSRPPSARSGMVVTLRINLLPGGELNDVNILESSGNSAFDSSALAAVRNARRFSVPSDPAKFDRYFRTLKLRFAPDDLLY